MSTVDPSTSARFLSALQDPQAEVVCVGPRARWARPVMRAIWSLAVYGAMGMGVFTAGVKLAEISGLDGELAARANPMQVLATKPQDVHWVNLPASPFLEVARTEEGGYSTNRLIGAYKAAGMTEAQGIQVAARLRDFSPVLMGARDDRLEASFRNQAAATAAALRRDFPVFHRRLAAMIDKQEVHISYRRGRWDHPENWPGVRSSIWAAQGAMESGSVEKDELSSAAFVQARETAELAVMETGVRALRVYPSNWSAAGLLDISTGLLDAEADLEEATGLEGQVLGLGGRVVLMMGSPPKEMQAAGVTRVAKSGAMEINAEWNNLAHEWFHALDFAAAQHVLSAPALDTLSEQLQTLRMTENRQAFNAWKLAIDEVTLASPKWQAARVRRAKGERLARESLAERKSVPEGAISSPDYKQDYWISHSEGMAYAFQAFVSDHAPLVLQGRTAEHEDFRMPSPSEVKMQRPAWRRLFATVQPLGLTQPMPEPPQLHASTGSPSLR